ncbi:Acyl-CoA N-acyltransferase [Cordyceps javanica]|uniref:Acyl-CoA N-acyltransferase n=1 Tax=Cordyceps javanica TaxID=43265 RepID=A0A545UW23_9HYPO|nr:Acyl-CoA N-acyltransferase [Cordyceps javanica]
MTAQSAAQATGRLSFQTATLSHVAALRALVVSAFRGPSSREGWTTEADLFTDERISEAGLVAKIQRPASKVVMVLDDQSGTLLGCAEIVGGGQGPVAQIGMVAVAPRSQGRGIGKALMAHLEQIGRAEYQAESMELYD